MNNLIRVRIENVLTGTTVADLFPASCEISRRQDEAGAWKFTVPMSVATATELENYCRVYFYWSGDLVMDGLVDKVQRKLSGDKVTYDISGLGELADLTRTLSKKDSHYQNVSITAILVNLLASTSGWLLGDTSTMIDPSQATTIDLRDEERLFAQLTKTVKAVPSTHLRYGGIDALGNRLVDVGYFGVTDQIQLIQGTHRPTGAEKSDIGFIVSIDKEENRSELLNQIAAIGGTYTGDDGVEHDVTLGDALSADPTLATDPDFPIVDLGGGDYVVRNNSLYPSLGASIRKRYEVHITDNDQGVPTTAEVQEAGLAVYWKAKAELMARQEADESYSVEVVDLGSLPEIGNLIRVDANYITTVLDEFTGDRVQLPNYTIHDMLRVIEWRLKQSGDKVSVNFKLTEGEDILNSDLVVQLFDAIETRRRARLGAGLVSAITNGSAQTNSGSEGPGVAWDCTQNSGLRGKSVTVPLPTPPDWATSVTLGGAPWSDPANSTLEITQYPALPATDLIVCATIDGTNWSTTDQITVYATFVFS